MTTPASAAKAPTTDLDRLPDDDFGLWQNGYVRLLQRHLDDCRYFIAYGKWPRKRQQKETSDAD